MRFRRSLLALVVLAPAAAMFGLAADRYFFQDDFLNFGLARTEGLTWHYLTLPIFGHLAPAHRLIDLAVERLFPIDFRWALLFLVVFFAGSVLLLQLILEELAGRVWWTWVVTAWLAIAVAWFPSIQWWAAGLHTEPATFLSLLCLYAYFRHRRARSPKWLALSVTSFVAGLLFYEKPLLIGLYVGLAPFLLTDVKLEPGSLLRAARTELATWIAFAIPASAYLIVYFTHHYYFSTGHASPTALAQYLRIVWLRGFGWMTQGLAFPSFTVKPLQTVAVVLVQLALALALAAGAALWRRRGSRWTWLTVLGAALAYLLLAGVIQRRGALAYHTTSIAEVDGQLILLGLAVWSIVRTPARWRVWLFFVVGFLANVMVIGVPRVAAFGPGLGYDDRYFVEISFLLAITVTAAFAPTRAEPERAGGPVRPAAAATAALLAAAYGLGAFATIQAFRSSWDSPGARAYVENLQTSIERAGSPVTYSVLDAPVPGWIVPAPFAPFNQLSNVAALVQPKLQFNRVGGRHYQVQPDGHFRPVHFRALAGGPVVAGRSGPTVTGGTPGARPLCARTNVTLAVGRMLPPDNLYLALGYGGATSGRPILVSAVAATGPIGTVQWTPTRSAGAALLQLSSSQFSALTLVQPAGATICIRYVKLGRFSSP